MRRLCKNIVFARVINSMTEFKQIIGRGTRVRDDYGKLYFNILDYTGAQRAYLLIRNLTAIPPSSLRKRSMRQASTIPGTEIIDQPEEAIAEAGGIAEPPVEWQIGR